MYFRTITSFILKHADRVVASSSHDFEIFASLVPDIKLIENGVDYSRLANVHKDIESGLMLYIGRLASNKRVDNLIRCLAKVRESIPYAHLALVGLDLDNIAQPLRDLARNLGVADAVTITGQVSDTELAQWLSRAHIFVSASEYEAFGISVLEAMSTGTIPVVNCLKSFQNFIQDGKSGFLTDFAQPDKAALVIAGVLQTGREELFILGKLAKETSARYDWKNTVKSFIEVYREICA
jgi:alpha-1,3-mannosyltransferase